MVLLLAGALISHRRAADSRKETAPALIALAVTAAYLVYDNPAEAEEDLLPYQLHITCKLRLDGELVAVEMASVTEVGIDLIVPAPATNGRLDPGITTAVS